MTSIKINIHPKTQALLKQKFLALVQNQTQSYLKTHMTTFIIWNIIMKTLTLLIHKNEVEQDEFYDKTNDNLITEE